MTDFEINYDTRPYLPDIFIKESIYSSFDVVNNNNNVMANSTIFVFNINEPISSIYNDPLYLLYGIKKDSSTTYTYPSLNFFYISNIAIGSYLNLIETSVPEYKISSNLRNLLVDIGYNTNKINESQFVFQELTLKEIINGKKTTVLYFYFNFNPDEIPVMTNYNNYSSTIYYNNAYWNILIYPYTTINQTQSILIPYEITYNYNNLTQFKSNGRTTIDTIDFDDREYIKYYEKIDYKYLENDNFTMKAKTNMETLQNYTFNIKNYFNYINSQSNKVVVNIGLNEVCKLYYPTSDYLNLNSQTYTITKLNNKHVNNYKCLSNNVNAYSFTADNKLSNLNKITTEQKKYSCYEYDIVNNPTTYQLVKNYYLNTYYDIFEYECENSIIAINYNLHKLFLLINPKIIDENYLLSNVKTNIAQIFSDSNILKFGIGINKIKLYVEGNIKSSPTYYLNKFKITFEFADDELNTWTWIIVLGIVFYNSQKICILDTNSTTTTSQLAYTNYTTIETSISVSPCVSNFNNNVGKIYENMLNLNMPNVKKYSWLFDYKFLSLYPSQNSTVGFASFYFYIPNVRTKLITQSKKYYSNLLNVINSKVNNLILNTININDNILNIKTTNANSKNYLNDVILFDNNIILKSDREQEQINDYNQQSPKINSNCLNQINNYDTTNYIEYFTFSPKIASEYISINQNYVGKYNRVLLYPSNINTNSFGPIPFGKYLKFNYLNWSLKYPTTITEEFVKSIKTVEDIINYDFSMLVMLPYNLNQDDNFYCSSPDYYFSTEYSMGIGGNHTCVYLVLTDKKSIPYQFYNDEQTNPNEQIETTQGIIYGIKLFNQSNYMANNMNLKLLLNLYYNKYINLTQLIILAESYIIYLDSNNVVWNINDSYLQIHNFEHLKEIIYYDFKRFKNCYDSAQIESEYNKFNYKFLQIIYDNKYQLNKIFYSTKILVYLTNLFKSIGLLKKSISYCEILKINMMLGIGLHSQTLIGIVKYNIGQVSNLFEINYNLNVSSGTMDTRIYTKLSNIYMIDTQNSLENINEHKIECVYILNYLKDKINWILKLLDANTFANVYYQVYNIIYNSICLEEINYWLGCEIEFGINDMILNTSPNLFDGIVFQPYVNTNTNTNTNAEQIRVLLLEQLGAFVYACVSNLTKIDELYNLAKLMANSTINSFLPSNLNNQVVKNNYEYNTTCYQSQTNISPFDIITFLTNTTEIINKLSSSVDNPDTYTYYVKAIQEGILTFISNTQDYFTIIINKIVHVYNFERNIIDPNSINIYDPLEIADFYHILTEFSLNYNSFADTLYSNKINLFYEYNNLFKSFENLLYSCEEFLLYVRLWNDFTNPNITQWADAYVNEDLYKIIHLDVFYDFLTRTLESFKNILVPQTVLPIQTSILQDTLIYFEKIKTKYIEEQTQPLEKNLMITITNIIMGLRKQIDTGTPMDFTPVLYSSYYVIPYQDLLLFKETFDWASFNFDSTLLEIVKTNEKLNTVIFNGYYNDPEVSIFYTQALNYTYLNTPYGYININNTVVNA